MSDRPGSPLLQAVRLWDRTSAKDSKYMSGRLGGVKIVILKNRDFNADDSAQSHTHSLFFTDGTTAQPKPQSNGTGVLPFSRELSPPPTAVQSYPMPSRYTVDRGRKRGPADPDYVVDGLCR